MLIIIYNHSWLIIRIHTLVKNKREAGVDKIIGVTEVQRNFKLVLDDVVNQQASYILTRHSRPVAALIPYEEYREYQNFKEKDFQERFDQVIGRMRAKAGEHTEEEVEADVRAAIEAIRRS